MGRTAFTESMKQRFTQWFKVPFEDADIIGSFRALEVLGIRAEELFATWVPETDVCIINGQCIKKIGTTFVVNYDIPALIHKNSKNTDIAVMVFRSSVSYDHIRQLVQEMHESLCVAGILNKKFDASRAFHFSKSPFEQIRDGIAYFSCDRRLNFKLEDLTYARWLLDRGVNGKEICHLLMNPIVEIQQSDGKIIEENFLQYTQFDDFETAFQKYKTIMCKKRYLIHLHLPQM